MALGSGSDYNHHLDADTGRSICCLGSGSERMKQEERQFAKDVSRCVAALYKNGGAGLKSSAMRRTEMVKALYESIQTTNRSFLWAFDLGTIKEGGKNLRTGCSNQSL